MKYIILLAILLVSLSIFVTNETPTLLPKQTSSVQTTNTPLPTPVPTAINYDLLPKLETLLQENGGCNLPCWWGFNVGESKEVDWLVFLDEQGLIIDETDLYLSNSLEKRGGHINYSLGSWYADFSLGFAFTDERLTYIRATITDPDKWLSSQTTRITLSEVIAQLKNSPEIYVFTDSVGQWFIDQISIMLINDDQGIIVDYVLDISNLQTKPVDYNALKFCAGIEETKKITITLQDPESDEVISQDRRTSIQPEDGTSGYHPIDEILGISTEEFVEFFRENPDECLDVSEYKAEQ